MKIISVTELRTLSNMLHEESNVSLRRQIMAWINSTATNHEHTQISSLAAMADNSVIKDKIMDWVSNVTSPKPEFIYIPDIPAQMIEEPKVEAESPKEEPIIESTAPVAELKAEPKIKKTRKKKID